VKRAGAAAVTIAVLALGMAGCTGAGARKVAISTAVVTTAKVYETTMNAESADFQSAFAVTSGNAKAGESSSESGVFSWWADRGQVTLQANNPGLWAATTEEVIDGDTTYTKLISKSGQYASAFIVGYNGDGWTESTLTGNLGGGLLSLFSDGFLADIGGVSVANEPDTLSPSTLLSVLAKDTTSTTEVGTQSVNGIETTHYRVLVPLSNLGANPGDAALAKMVLGVTNLPVDYWVDSSDRLRQLRMSETIKHFSFGEGSTLPPQTTTTTDPNQVILGQSSFNMKAVNAASMKLPITVSVTLDLSNYGVTANAPIPTPDQITGHQSCVISASGFTCQGQ
jgi:hypothetical protein